MEQTAPLLSPDSYMPHGQCILWQPGLLSLHVVSDTLIWGAYLMIPIILVYFIRKRRDMPFPGIFALFGAFIVACGTTHLMEVWTIWQPHYWTSGLIKAVTAAVSWATVVQLIPVVPQALSLRSPDELQAINTKLEQEIFKRKRSEDSLRQSQELLKVFWENSPSIKFIKDRQGRYLDVNPQFSKVTPLPLEQIIGKTDEEIFPPERAASFRAHDLKVLEENQALEFEETAEHEDGPHTSVVYKFPLRDRQGQTCGVCGIVTDITERERADAVRKLLIHKIMTTQEEERQRLARELHDETGQSLTSLLVGLRRLGEMPTLDTAHKLAEELRTLTAKTLEEIKRLALGLHPHVLDELGLEAALNQFAEEFEKTHGVRVDMISNGFKDRRLPQAVEMTLYRIAQETLTNIAKHAHATSASIILRATLSDVHMIVEDDGHGFDTDEMLKTASMAKHLGIHGMRRRAILLNGSLSIESTPGEGTTVYVKIPLLGVQDEASDSHSR